jgi:hypothetical protein
MMRRGRHVRGVASGDVIVGPSIETRRTLENPPSNNVEGRSTWQLWRVCHVKLFLTSGPWKCLGPEL